MCKSCPNPELSLSRFITIITALWGEVEESFWYIKEPSAFPTLLLQIALTCTQIWWTTEVGIAFSRLEEGYENAIKDYNKKQVHNNPTFAYPSVKLSLLSWPLFCAVVNVIWAIQNLCFFVGWGGYPKRYICNWADIGKRTPPVPVPFALDPRPWLSIPCSVLWFHLASFMWKDVSSSDGWRDQKTFISFFS